MEYHDMQCRTPTPSNRSIRLRCNTASPEDRSVRKHASPEDRGNSESGDRRRGLRSRFKMLQTLGEGTYGKVRLAVERDTGIKYAIKTIRKNRISSSSDLIRIRREIEIMSRLGHPHIISVHQVYENKDKIVLVMEYASGGELYEYINQRTSNNNAKPTAVGGSGTTGGGADVQSGNSSTSRTTSKTTDGLPDHEARKFFRQIVSAVYYLHQNGIVHRDLKLENIFIDCRGYAKIGDFGLANLYEEGSCLRTFCGSPLYASPEIVNGRPYVGPEADCWSLGVLLYTLVYGAMPFDGSDFHRLRSQISEGKYYQPACKSEASDLIRQLLTVDVSMRATPEAAATHWWTNLGYSGTPIDNYSCLGRPVDYHSLKEIVRVDDPVNGNTSIDGPSGDNIDNGNVMSDDALDCQDHKPRGILKKYKNHVDNDTSLHHAVSPMNSCYSRSPTPSNRASPVIVPSTHVSGDDNLPKHRNHDNVYKQQQRTHLAVPSTKHVYDSQRKPRKGILKNMDFLDKAAEDTRARMINNGNDVNMISIVANGNYLRSDESDFYDYFSKQPSPRQGSPYNLTPAMGDHHFDRSRQSPSLDRSPYHSPVPSQQSSLLTQEQQDLLTLYAPDYLNYATHTCMLQAHSGGISYDSGISEPNSMSRLEDVHGSAWTTSVHESSSSGKQGKDKWDHERTDSQESNMSVGSSLWGGSSHSSGVIISNNDSEDSLSSSQASTVTYPAARNHQLYDLNALKASLPDDEEEFNQCIAANRAINRLVNRSLDSDEVFKESKHNHYAVVPEYKRAAISRDIDVMVSARLSLSNSSVEHRAVEPSLGNGDSYAEDVASKRLSYGSTASSHASSVDTSIRSKDDVRNSLAFDEEDDFAGVDSLHRSPPAAPPTQHHGIMVNLLQEQIV